MPADWLSNYPGNPMNITATTRQSMIIAGLLQGAAMLALHEWLKADGFTPGDMVWVAPAYILAVLAPITFNFLRGEFSAAQSLAGTSMSVTIIAATAAWFGGSFGSNANAAKHVMGFWATGIFVFALTSVVVWFVSLPFIQARLRENAWSFPYPRLFDDAWRNILLVSNCIAFTGLFWVLLTLWAGLFLVLHMGFFKDLFTSRFFFYIASAMAVSFAVSLEEKEATAFTTLRRYMLAFQTRLLPLAALIVVLFLGALPVSGLDPVWGTGHATPLMLSLQIAIVFLVNAAWQDGEQAPPFSSPVQWLIRAALAFLPVLSALSIWSLSQRIDQYGWSIDRVWAAVAVGLATLYSLGYAAGALQRGWLPILGKVNTWMALFLIGTLLSIHTPLLDPQRISASSQVSRLLSGAIEVEKFDFNYLRFTLGRSGDDALKTLAQLSGHAKADEIRAKAKETLSRTDRHSAKQPPIPLAAEIATRLKAYPAGAEIPAGFAEYLHARLAKNPFEYALGSLKTGKPVPMIMVDLGGDQEPEVILIAAPYPVFAYTEDKWHQIGQINFTGPAQKPEEIQRLLEESNFAAVPRQWSDLRLGDKSGMLVLRASTAKE